MIIGLGLLCPFSGGVLAQEKVRLPDPVGFAVAMELGDVSRAREWLDGGLPVDFMGSRIGTGLMLAAWEGNIPLMELFLSRGAEINKRNANGETAVALAAWKGKTEAVRWLLARGARLNADRPDALQWTPLHYAAFSGHQELAEELVAKGADVNARSPNGSSALMLAIYEGKEDLVRLLLEKGADRAIKNDWGDGALEWAMRGNRLKIARMITTPEEFNIAVAQPKEKWGEPVRSVRSSPELEQLLRARELLAQRNLSTKAIDNKIAAERVRIVRAEMERVGQPTRAATLEISASRQKPGEQSANVVYGPDGKAQGYKVPTATFAGKPKMPVKVPVRNY